MDLSKIINSNDFVFKKHVRVEYDIDHSKSCKKTKDIVRSKTSAHIIGQFYYKIGGNSSIKIDNNYTVDTTGRIFTNGEKKLLVPYTPQYKAYVLSKLKLDESSYRHLELNRQLSEYVVLFFFYGVQFEIISNISYQTCNEECEIEEADDNTTLLTLAYLVVTLRFKVNVSYTKCGTAKYSYNHTACKYIRNNNPFILLCNIINKRKLCVIHSTTELVETLDATESEECYSDKLGTEESDSPLNVTGHDDKLETNPTLE